MRAPVILKQFIRDCHAHLEWICAEITGDRPRQPAYEMKLMLSRVSWALGQISCRICEIANIEYPSNFTDFINSVLDYANFWACRRPGPTKYLKYSDVHILCSAIFVSLNAIHATVAYLFFESEKESTCLEIPTVIEKPSNIAQAC